MVITMNDKFFNDLVELDSLRKEYDQYLMLTLNDKSMATRAKQENLRNKITTLGRLCFKDKTLTYGQIIQNVNKALKGKSK